MLKKFKKIKETVSSSRTFDIGTFTNIFLIACYLQTSSYYCERSYDTSGNFDGYGSLLYLWMQFFVSFILIIIYDKMFSHFVIFNEWTSFKKISPIYIIFLSPQVCMNESFKFPVNFHIFDNNLATTLLINRNCWGKITSKCI